LKFFLNILIWTLLSLPATAQEVLSAESKVSLITVAPGEELYSGFGHSAYRVVDPKLGFDKVYNYGTFEFNEDFYGKFIQGKLDYMLTIQAFQDLLDDAIYEKRSVTEQVLNLSSSQKDSLYKFLEWNALQENKYYKYDFFYDNCSSRLRDVMQGICKGSLTFDNLEERNLSFRQLIDEYLRDKEVQDFGMDIGLGAPSDVKATPLQYMFLPDHLMNGFAKATLHRNGKNIPLVGETKVIYASGHTLKATPFMQTPFFYLSVLLFIVILVTIKNWNKPATMSLLDSILYIIVGLLGCLLVFLWFFTDHKVTVNNWNLLWANPLVLFFPILFRIIKNKDLVSKIFIGYGILLVLELLALPILPQQFNIAEIPLVLILALRSFYIGKNIEKHDSKPVQA
jgi:hypothetical protein